MRKSIILFSLFTTILFLLVACQGSIYSRTAGMAFYPEASASSEACYCTAIYDPVCGVDGITYSNRCQAGCAGIAVAYEGECQVNSPPELSELLFQDAIPFDSQNTFTEIEINKPFKLYMNVINGPPLHYVGYTLQDS